MQYVGENSTHFEWNNLVMVYVKAYLIPETFYYDVSFCRDALR